jgi:hypothetical protein
LVGRFRGWIRDPILILKLRGDLGLAALADGFQALIFVVHDFQEKHPAELLQALGIAGDSL